MTRILVVEDDPDVAEWVVHCVAAPGREIRAVDSLDGVRTLWRADAAWRADLLLLDYDLPGTDGVDLLDEARERWPRAGCIFVTALWSGEVRDRIASTGSRRIAKPFDPATLQSAVDRALGEEDGS